MDFQVIGKKSNNEEVAIIVTWHNTWSKFMKYLISETCDSSKFYALQNFWESRLQFNLKITWSSQSDMVYTSWFKQLY